MNDIIKNIKELLGTDEDIDLKNVIDIRKQCSSFQQFREEINNSQLSIAPDKINKLFILISLLAKNEIYETGDISWQKKIQGIVKRELKLQDNDDIINVTDFIIDILNKTNNEAHFKNEMIRMESGLADSTLSSIYSLYLKGKRLLAISNDNKVTQLASTDEIKLEEEKSTSLDLPNEPVQWEDLSDVSDLFGGNSSKSNEIRIEGQATLYHIYVGIITKVTKFGCFVRLLNVKKHHCEGLVHVSEIPHTERANNPTNRFRKNQQVYVQVVKIHPNGKISLSMKNLNQTTGKIISPCTNILEEERGRKRERENNTNSERKFAITKRKLTSPERWEIRQLIASGAVSSEEYPELNTTVKDGDTVNNTTDIDANDKYLDVELNLNDKPAFLKHEKSLGMKKFDMSKIVKVPKSSMNRAAMNGSKTMKEHREEKIQKKKNIEQLIREKRNLNDPTKNPQQIKQEIEDLKKQLVVTSWEKKRQKEKVRFGKPTSLPISDQKKSLPVFTMRNELIKAIKDNQFLVIVGETGSGKTTQITQYLDEEGFSNSGMIGCTQPRRVAAISVAKRVAEEMNCKLSEEVGYSIRFEERTSPRTRIKYMTDGMLQREALLDPLMSKYSVIMLDEAHERTVATDILFALLKKAAMKRPELKVIITSATLNSSKFSNYFNDCPIINIPGKTFPVEVLYSQSPQMDYIEAALECVLNIHINEGPGDILVFLTGQEEIDSCCEILYERVKTLGDVMDELLILPVYSALPSEIQSKIFEPTPEGSRKVIFATNIAETSITIDGIYYVVDPGFAKINTYNPKTGMEQLIICPISQAQANQRKGRAGRTGPGKCYRLYTESAFYNEMLPNSVPEIQRQNLSNTILMLKAMGINDLLNFDFMDPPPRNLMVYALNELFNLGALDTDGYITKLGKRMSQFPMDPTLSRSLLASVTNGCSEEIITIISMLSIQNVFFRPKDKQQIADSRKARFHHPYGDHLTLLNVYTQWDLAGRSDQFCEINFLHARHLKRARDIKIQITDIFRKNNIPITKCYGDPDLIRKTLLTGFFMNTAKRNSTVGYKTILGNTIVGIHPSSALCGRDYDYVMYHSLILTSREYMSQVTCINPEWLVECAPHFYKVTDANSKSRKKARIMPLHNRFSKDQNSWRLSSIRQSREKALGIKR